MRKNKTLLLLLVICLFFAFSCGRIWAEERNIYVGDLIELKIEAQDLTLDELKDKFKDFDIVDVSNIPKGYIVTLRSFETGEKTVQLGDKELTIIVKSTLNEIERKNVYEGDLKPLGTGFYIKWIYIFIPLALVFLLSLIFNILKLVKKRKRSLLNPYERFNKAISDLSVDQEDFLVKLTLCFKEYLQTSFSFHIKGKTSTEIIYEINRMPRLNEKLPQIEPWLKESDYFKFSGASAPIAKKLELMERLTELVKSIEQSKEGDIQ